MSRLELLSDAELDALREHKPEESARALSMMDALDESLDATLSARGLADDVVRRRLSRKPILAVWVCLQCGAADIGQSDRSWAVDDAMRRGRLGERDVLAIERLITEAWEGATGPSLDALPAGALHELAELVGADVDLEALRARIETLARISEELREEDPTSETRPRDLVAPARDEDPTSETRPRDLVALARRLAVK